MNTTRYKILVLSLALSLSAVGDDTTVSENRAWQFGRTERAVTNVYTKDPADELERNTAYLDERLFGLLSKTDGEEIKCRMYCVIKFNREGRFRIKMTCRADGNHQIIAFSPRSRSFKRQDFLGVKVSRTLALEFDSSDSRYLVLNCTRGNLFVDGLAIEEIDGQQSVGGGVPGGVMQSRADWQATGAKPKRSVDGCTLFSEVPAANGQPQAARRGAKPSNMPGLGTTVLVFTGGLGLHLESSARPANAGLAHK